MDPDLQSVFLVNQPPANSITTPNTSMHQKRFASRDVLDKETRQDQDQDQDHRFASRDVLDKRGAMRNAKAAAKSFRVLTLTLALTLFLT